MGYRQGNTTAAGAKIQHVRVSVLRQFFERCVHQRFRIRARDQHVRGNAELESVKFPPADQIGDRLAGSPASNEFPEAIGRGRVGCIVAVRGKPGAGHAHCMAEQDLRFPPGVDEARARDKIARRIVEQAADRRIHACAANVSSAIAASSSA